MGQPTVRITARARATLRALARREGHTMQEVLDLAIEEYRRRCFLEETNAAFARLRDDAAAWGEVREERADWEGSLLDGMGDELPWPLEPDREGS